MKLRRKIFGETVRYSLYWKCKTRARDFGILDRVHHHNRGNMGRNSTQGVSRKFLGSVRLIIHVCCVISDVSMNLSSLPVLGRQIYISYST